MDGREATGARKTFKVYTIVEKPGAEKGIWLEIGVATENRDGSMSVKLDALPVNGAIHIREYVPKLNNGFRRDGERTPLNPR